MKYILREEDGFAIKEDFPDMIQDGISLVIMTEPNNPTGVLTDRRLKQRILEKCENICPQHLPIRKLLEDVAGEFEKK